MGLAHSKCSLNLDWRIDFSTSHHTICLIVFFLHSNLKRPRSPSHTPNSGGSCCHSFSREQILGTATYSLHLPLPPWPSSFKVRMITIYCLPIPRVLNVMPSSANLTYCSTPPFTPIPLWADIAVFSKFASQRNTSHQPPSPNETLPSLWEPQICSPSL